MKITRSDLLWLLGFWLLVSGWAYFSSMEDTAKAQMRLENAHETTAVVTGLSYTSRRKGGTTHYVTYRYEGVDGKTYSGKTSVPETIWRSIKSGPESGKTIQIYQDKNRPYISDSTFRWEMKAETTDPERYMTVGMGGLLGALVLLVLLKIGQSIYSKMQYAARNAKAGLKRAASNIDQAISAKSSGGTSQSDKLRELKKLLDDGVISSSDFEKKKAEILQRL
jgi:hypothetical protein